MKKTAIASFMAILLIGAPVFAEELPTQTSKSDLTASATPAQKDTPTDTKKTKTDTVLTKKQKIEADLRSTVSKLTLVIDRTQTLIDLLTKNEKDTTEAQTVLDTAKGALDEASTAIDQFAGVVAPEVPVALGDTPPVKPSKTKEPALFKDPLKKAQDSLKASKTALLQSITILKEGLLPKDDVQQ